jgi:hypothetical protein
MKWFLENTNKIKKPLAILIKRKKYKTQIHKISSELLGRYPKNVFQDMIEPLVHPCLLQHYL